MAIEHNRFPWIFTVLWLVILSIMVTAGFWQLGRAAEKEQIKTRLLSAENMSPRGIEDWQRLHVFDQVEVTGQYLDTHFLLDNQIMNGQVGFFVFTAFRTVDGILMLVNRGWSEDDTQNFAVNDDFPKIKGLVADWPRPGIKLGQQTIKEQSIQHLTYIDEKPANELLKKRHCRVNHEENCIFTTQVLKLNADMNHGFERQWQLPRMTVEKHRAYAFQWFTMSLALCLVYMIFLKKTYFKQFED